GGARNERGNFCRAPRGGASASSAVNSESSYQATLRASVVLVPSPGRLAPLDYRLPPACESVAPGTRVLVPLGTRRSMGVVVEVHEDGASDTVLRDVIAVLDAEPVLDRSLLELVHWMGDYYLGSLGEAFATVLPAPLRIDTERVVTLHDDHADRQPLSAQQRRIVEVLSAGECTAAALARRVPGAPGALRRLQQRGIVRIVERLRREVAPTRRLRFYEAAEHVGDDDVRLARRPALPPLYSYLRDHPLRRAPTHELSHSFANAATKLRALVDAGLVRMREEETYRPLLRAAAPVDRPVRLTPAQQTAVDAIVGARGEGFVPWLLWGVTGSGKTEVYLRAVAAARAKGGGALILVPEISLTHQLVERMRARFGDALAVLHSQLGVGERWDEWRRIA